MIKKIVHWFNSPAQVYYICKMTGLYCDDMREAADRACDALQAHGIVVHHPIIKERIPKTHTMLQDRSEREMAHLWGDDKKAIKWANVIIDSAAGVYSTGSKREFGKSRYRDWSPTITLWDKGVHPPYIARNEDDICVTSVEEAAAVIQKLWGTRLKRMAWKLPIYITNWHDLSLYKLYRFFK